MEKRKSIIALLVILVMVLTIIPFKVFAAPTQAELPNLVEIRLRKATNVSINNGEATISYENGTALVTAQGIQYSIKENQQVGMQDGNPIYGNVYYLYTTDTNVTFNLMPNDNHVAKRWENGQPQDVENNKYTMNSLQVGQGKDQEVEFTFEYAGGGNNGGETPATYGNTNAVVTVRGAEGTFEETVYNPETHTENTVNTPYKRTYNNARIWINGSMVPLDEMNAKDEGETFNNFKYNYPMGATDNGKVQIVFSTLFIYKYVSINVNGTQVPVGIDYENRDNYLDHYNRQELTFSAEVDKADSYIIELKIEPTTTSYIGNFLWTANPDEEYRTTPDGGKELNDDFIAHSKIEFVKVKYERNGNTITKKLSELNDSGEVEVGPGQYWHVYDSGDNSVEFGSLTKVNNTPVNYDEGSMVLADGAEVTLKITPEYGYQVTAFTINGDDVITGDNISEFTFKVKGGNAHIGARVEKVNDDVKSTAAAVKGGEIILGENELTSGTARLSVNDANLSEEKVEKFEEEVGNEYEINSILDINLNQVFFKGKGTEDVWTGDKLEDLNSTATVGLTLDKKVDPQNTVVAHNIHNGTDYEKIEIRGYDEETNTIYFPVESFSSYAIATKTSEVKSGTEEKTDSSSEKENSIIEKVKSVKTGDAIMFFVSTMALSTIALIISKRKNKTRKISKH